ncbi:MAG TPA: hypothetical protein VEM57_01425 [Candidatus Binatus sp.]|nr:hypothetical protein [Candidatus Binatus sp.]
MRSAALLLGALTALAAPVSAAVVNVTDCTLPPVVARGRTTTVDVGSDDVVLQCALVPLPGTGRITVRANRITVAGPAGSINTPTDKLAIRLKADADITLEGTSIEASGNGSIRLLARTGVEVRTTVITTGDVTRTGRAILFQCVGTGCPLFVSRSNVVSNLIKVVISGPITTVNSTFLTRGARALLTLRSRNDAANLCCSTFQGTNEGNVFINAFGKVDLTGSQVLTGENIRVHSGLGGTGASELLGATLSNDFGKEGQIDVSAASGASQIDIDGATLIDDDFPRSVTDVSSLNGREQLPHQGFNNTVGTPQTDM